MAIEAELKRFQILEAGEYPAKLVSIDGGEGEHGLFWIWSFEIDNVEQEVTGITTTTYSNYPSKSYKWATALGHPGDVDFNAATIFQSDCRVIVDVVERDGVERNKVTGVLAPRQEKRGLFK